MPLINPDEAVALSVLSGPGWYHRWWCLVMSLLLDVLPLSLGTETARWCCHDSWRSAQHDYSISKFGSTRLRDNQPKFGKFVLQRLNVRWHRITVSRSIYSRVSSCSRGVPRVKCGIVPLVTNSNFNLWKFPGEPPSKINRPVTIYCHHCSTLVIILNR